MGKVTPKGVLVLLHELNRLPKKMKPDAQERWLRRNRHRLPEPEWVDGIPTWDLQELRTFLIRHPDVRHARLRQAKPRAAQPPKPLKIKRTQLTPNPNRRYIRNEGP